MITAVLSAKGGVGKTTVSTNLALALHKMGKDTVLVDGDYRNPNVCLHLGKFESSTGIQDIIQGKAGVMESLYIHESGMKYIPAKLSMSYMGLKADGLNKILREAETDMILDSAPGINDDVMAVIETSDKVIIVTTPEIPSLADAMRTIEVCKKMGKEIQGIVVNRLSKHHKIRPSEIEAVTGIPVIGVVPEDKRVTKSLREKRLVIEAYPHAKASVALMNMAAHISGNKYEEKRLAKVKRIFK